MRDTNSPARRIALISFPVASQLPAGVNPAQFWLGKWILLRADPEDPSLTARRHLVRISEIEHSSDPLVLDEGGFPVDVTRLRWEDAQALPFEMCLRDMTVRGNLIFATAGETLTDFFSIRDNNSVPANLAPDVVRAVERQGALDAVDCVRNAVFLHSLRETQSRGLGWLGQVPGARPELELREVDPLTLQALMPPQIWQWQRSLVDDPSCGIRRPPFNDQLGARMTRAPRSCAMESITRCASGGCRADTTSPPVGMMAPFSPAMVSMSGPRIRS